MAQMPNEQPDHANILAQGRQQLQAGQFQAAGESANAVLLTQPNHPDALYLLAVSQRYRQDVEGALQNLALLTTQDPTLGRAYQESGHCYLAINRQKEALEAFQHAVQLNNSLLASWQAISRLTSTSEHPNWHEQAADQANKLAALPPALLSVRNMISEGKWFKAEQLCRNFLQQQPKHVEAMRLLADLGIKSEVLDDAEFILESAVAFEPDNVLARFDYMNVLYRRQKYAESMAQATLLREAMPGNQSYRTAYANQCVAVGRFDEALAIYDDVIQQMPGSPELHLLRGHALKTVDRTEDAIADYQKAYGARPDFGDAYWSLANLKTYRFGANEILAMQQQLDREQTPIEDQAHLSFALGKAYEDAQDYHAAMNYYERGNLSRKQQLRYSADRMTENLDLQRSLCTAELFASLAGAGCTAPDPIFIVGLPRAGSTLLEQILASHSQVDGTLELPNISALAQRLGGRRMLNDKPQYPASLTNLAPEQLNQFGEAYLSDTQIFRQGAPYFIDKMPNNFRHIGLIHLILPNARIIDARRHPMACCFSGFKQLFAAGQEFTYGLPEIGQYYRDYVALMDHWDQVLPDKILRVQYEEVVNDTEGQVRRLLEFLGLDFEPECLAFHETQRSVRTPSSEQVRQPIYQSGLEQWRHFEPWLAPLKEALGPTLERYPITGGSTY
jgi:tetratricopeptide (TPR) repeat protein|tara:strand:- start:16727 stop:18751 length:2025 start_codon:yes stop_codon:yes gene_type:complete